MTEPQGPGPTPQATSWYGNSPFAQPTAGQAAPPTANQLPPGLRGQPVGYTAMNAPASQEPRPVVVRSATPVPGLLIITIGLVLLIVSMTTLTWFSSDFISANFGELHHSSGLNSAPWWFQSYFEWQAVTYLILSFVGAYTTKLINPANLALRVVFFLYAVGGAVTTFLAPLDVESFHTLMKSADAGYWSAVAGFLCIAAGVVIRV